LSRDELVMMCRYFIVRRGGLIRLTGPEKPLDEAQQIVAASWC
jgi:hypothetical protein